MARYCPAKLNVASHQRNEKLTLIVVIITLITMMVEIIAGLLSGSMALLSDGIHMGTHAIALFITLMAYIFARKQQSNPSFTFGTGKVGVLGGYTNAILLIIAAFAMAVESIERLINPVNILFNEAIIVAIAGLIVNLISAAVLGHGHDSEHHQNHQHTHQDHNLKAAYLHVITDAFTSVLAITALLTGKYFGLHWTDPLVGILGAIVVAKWAVGLISQTGSILLDKGDNQQEINRICSQIESENTKINDIHLWQISENHRSLILSLQSRDEKTAEYYRNKINQLGKFDHITIEVTRLSA